MWNSFENNWIVIRIASRFSKRAQDLNFSCFWALKYMGNFIGSNPFEPELDQNRGPVQSSGICLNRTIGPVHGSQKTGLNWTSASLIPLTPRLHSHVPSHIFLIHLRLPWPDFRILLTCSPPLCRGFSLFYCLPPFGSRRRRGRLTALWRVMTAQE